MLRFFLPVAFAIAASITISILGYEIADDMWSNHVRDGKTFLEGEIPENPSFPMWGYSFLAAVAGPFIPIYQGIFLVCVLCFWFWVIRTTQVSTTALLGNSYSEGVIVALILLPYIALAVSYWSNSVFAMLIVFGAAMLRLCSLERSKYYLVVLTGLLFGLSYNIRTEGLVFCSALILAMFVHRFISRDSGYSSLKLFWIILVMVVCVIPWYTYTSNVLEKPRVGTTNSAGVAYVSLGINQDNPWGIEATDEFVWDMAVAEGHSSPWTEGADAYFGNKLIEAITDYPTHFVAKLLKNVQLQSMQGVYLYNFRVFYGTEVDKMRLDYVNERLKGLLGLKVNYRELKKYQGSAEVTDGVTFAHRAIVYSEFVLRAAYAFLFLLLNLAALVLALMTRFRHIESWFYLAVASGSVLMSALFITEPRMSTIIVPFAFWATVVSYSEVKSKKSHVFST